MGELNERTISVVEVWDALNEMKSGMAPSLDGFQVQCVNEGGKTVFEWLVAHF